ncbi:DUF1183-domain-containing protein [Fomitiporia mediterranea MF3/22]|uniref:DUF1183-domain-containing protein n=1 Tax=Fomitiporia mediterranea (strain MF3/22) TaxID=694068 RepID=UPI0004407710|nr:DUF1183-domain-containing protein [Fomitiporia mediterranea MF3/22]EJD07060.1 DUF1183-domain-containing protein [Fomitiporia mediterranea MF3/22]
MSRVALSSIRSLTLYKDEPTRARRLPPINQLKCVGKACKLFQPDVVRCYNNGGSGTEIDWTCEADLPEKLRFGRVDVSCEGYDHPGDPYVLKGSCGLEYRLVNISDNYTGSSWFQNMTWSDILERISIYSIVFLIIYILFKPYILRFLNWLKNLFSDSGNHTYPPSSSSRPNFSEFHSGGRGGPPPPPPDYPPPPPYSAQPKPYWSSWWPNWGWGSSNSWFSPTSPNPPSASSSGPGFWSGLGLGSLSGLAAARMFGGGERGPYYADQAYAQREYDWERERRFRGGGLFGSSSSSWFSPGRSFSSPRTRVVRTPPSNDDRGEGPSNLGSIRRSRGYGTTNVR